MAAMQSPPPRSMPNWIRTRIMNELPSDQPMPNRYEYSVYGAFNALLTTIFPAERNFSIAPQLLMRTNYDEDVRDTSASSIDVNVSFMLNEEVLAADMSTDNFGALVESRSAGAARSIVIPDFSILKVDAYGDAKGDKILTILEVKKDDQDLLDSQMQMRRYLEIARVKPRPSGPGHIFWAFLVLGDTTQHERLPEILELILHFGCTKDEADDFSAFRNQFSRTSFEEILNARTQCLAAHGVRELLYMIKAPELQQLVRDLIKLVRRQNSDRPTDITHDSLWTAFDKAIKAARD
ncbi:hypothetical protein BDQ12DRAFT_759968 [Crucibulum laeve]|uniref:Uncharacterized protein n=1 Tax=Crucibulum laeve TaxID=68775 RepID=A0A5C3LR52_9AGAR|nr:hypothetical protein BDQ12DRAFT_759968 [Crucibulum laeve]